MCDSTTWKTTDVSRVDTFIVIYLYNAMRMDRLQPHTKIWSNLSNLVLRKITQIIPFI